MKKQELLIFALCLTTGLVSCQSNLSHQEDSWVQSFIQPGNELRPQPFWHINGELTTEGIYEQITDSYKKDGFGGVAILPLTPDRMWGSDEICPGTTPKYLSEPYFDRYRDILECSSQLGTHVILYDDVDFPSGVTGGMMKEKFPQYIQKRLNKQEKEIAGPLTVTLNLETYDQFMGVMAMNETTKERLDLSEYVSNQTLKWDAPTGKWKIMAFSLEHNVDYRIDYMDEEAIDNFISITYDQYAKRFREYFGNTIQKTFYDDVGYLGNSRFWNSQLTENFEKRYNKKAVLYYPALWYDIGPETEAARVAFYGLRSEMIGEGYPKKVAEWSERHGLVSMGHPPGNYEPTTVDMYGDPFKYYRHTQIPLMDAIHGYPYGRPGFKLISSAADVFDRPTVAVEIYGNYEADMDSFMLYRGAMEVMARGVNFFIPHGMWYDPGMVKIPPLIAHYSELIGPALHDYSDYVARSVSLLDGGKRVADIALLYPIESLEAWYQFDTDRPTIGKDVPPQTDYNIIGDLLTGEIRQDFTFVHPQKLTENKYTVQNGEIKLNNRYTDQTYKLVIMPSMKVLSVEALKKIRDYYNQGGKILSTNLIPSKAAEFGKDEEFLSIIQDMFGINPNDGMPAKSFSVSNPKGGEILFLPEATKEALIQGINQLLPHPDVKIEPVQVLDAKYNPNSLPLGIKEYRNLPQAKLGMFSYIHKQKDGRDIYFFANSTNEKVGTWVDIKGKLNLEEWNPYTADIKKWSQVEYVKRNGEDYTRIRLQLDPVSSVFAVSK